MRANQLTSMPEETPNKKLRFDWVDWLATIAFVGILILAIAHFTQPISTSSTSYVPLQAYDFWVTNSTCLTEETTGAYKGAIYERFLVAVHNRFNETVHFVNASIYVDYIAFVDGSSKPIYSYFIEAGLND